MYESKIQELENRLALMTVSSPPTSPTPVAEVHETRKMFGREVLVKTSKDSEMKGPPKRKEVQQSSPDSPAMSVMDMRVAMVARAVLRVGDRNANGEMSFTEITQMLSGTPYQEFAKWFDSKGQTGFRSHDDNHDGVIDYEEMILFVAEFFKEVPKYQTSIDAMIRAAETDKLMGLDKQPAPRSKPAPKLKNFGLSFEQPSDQDLVRWDQWVRKSVPVSVALQRGAELLSNQKLLSKSMDGSELPDGDDPYALTRTYDQYIVDMGKQDKGHQIMEATAKGVQAKREVEAMKQHERIERARRSRSQSGSPVKSPSKAPMKLTKPPPEPVSTLIL